MVKISFASAPCMKAMFFRSREFPERVPARKAQYHLRDVYFSKLRRSTKYTYVYIRSYVTVYARDWQLHFEEFSRTLTRPRPPLPPSAPLQPPSCTGYRPFCQRELFLFLSLSFSLSLLLLLSLRLLFSGPTDFNSAPVGWIPLFASLYVRRYVFVHIFPGLSISLSPFLPLPFAPISPVRRPHLPPDRPLTGPPYARALAFSYFLTFSFLQCLKMQK